MKYKLYLLGILAVCDSSSGDKRDDFLYPCLALEQGKRRSHLFQLN